MNKEVTYLKPKEEFEKNKVDDETTMIVIQPLSREGVEMFSLWDNKEKKFYREGFKLKMDSRDEEVEVNRYIKLSDDEKNRYQRNVKIRREVLYDGKEVIYDMPLTVDKALINIMENIEEFGDPLSFSYKILRKSTGPNAYDVEYTVKKAEQQTGGATSSSEPVIEIDLEDDGELVLTKTEERLVRAMQKQFPNYANIAKDKKLPTFVKNGASISRAEKIVDEYLS